jgi:hypothetical protein
MSISELETAVKQLTPQELARFREWFSEFDAHQWDRQIEADIAAGKLDRFADEAIDDLRQGRCKDL